MTLPQGTVEGCAKDDKNLRKVLEVGAKVQDNKGVDAPPVEADDASHNVEVTHIMVDPSKSTRKPLSVRTRFEVFKRDSFTCRYCGKSSPEVVLEVDHIVPLCEGGDDDHMNLVTACWACNSGKAGVPLSEVITGEDPHDKAILMLERERQLREYNAVLAEIRHEREEDFCELRDWWCEQTHKEYIRYHDVSWLKGALEIHPREDIRNAMMIAIGKEYTRDFRYVAGILRNRRSGDGPY